MTFSVDGTEDGISLKQFICNHLHPSSKMLKSLKYKTNGITVNSEQKTVRTILHTGDTVTLQIEDIEEENASVIPVRLPVTIIFEDDDLIVVSKPADMPTHPSHNHWTDTVANALCYRADERNIPFVFRPINRLDRNTSGLLLVAKNKLSAGRLSDSMKKGRIRKTYLAVLDGEMTCLSGRIDFPLHRTKESIIVREVCDRNLPDADAAITDYRVLSVENGHTLVCAIPVTGRTHQLRVHFSHLGYPITGDDLYGKESTDIKRHALHAYLLSFPHPTSEKTQTFIAPLPDDFADLLTHYFSHFSIEEIADACKNE